MIKLINRNNGAEMWVSEKRVSEYLAKGHKLADAPAPVPTPKKRSKGKKE